ERLPFFSESLGSRLFGSDIFQVFSREFIASATLPIRAPDSDENRLRRVLQVSDITMRELWLLKFFWSWNETVGNHESDVQLLISHRLGRTYKVASREVRESTDQGDDTRQVSWTSHFHYNGLHSHT